MIDHNYFSSLAEVYSQLSLEVAAEDVINGTREMSDVHFIITDPTHNKIVSSNRKQSKRYISAELMWYLSRDLNPAFIGQYAKKWLAITNSAGLVASNYGNYIFPHNWNNVINLFHHDRYTRRAHILLTHRRYGKHLISDADIQCTIYLGFQIRQHDEIDKLDMFVRMRSNDVVWGLGNDMPVFAVFQEFMARQLGVPVGYYHHSADSMHVYVGMENRLDRDARDGGRILAGINDNDAEVFAHYANGRASVPQMLDWLRSFQDHPNRKTLLFSDVLSTLDDGRK